MCLACVFDDNEAVLVRQFENRVHVGHLTVEMHRNDGDDAMLSAALDQLAARAVELTALLQVFAQLLRIHGVGARVNIHKVDQRTGLRDCFGRGNKGERDRHRQYRHGYTPAAINAKRNASVPLLTPTQYFVLLKAANSRSNPSTIGPPMKPALRTPFFTTASSSSWSS